MNGVMGVANAERTLDYIRTITEFITQVRTHGLYAVCDADMYDHHSLNGRTSCPYSAS